MTRPLATVSIDLDPIDLHLAGYGFASLPPDASVYVRAVPRLLEHLGRHDVRATFFVVGRDATAQARALETIAAAGHEIASHSLTHPMALSRQPLEALRHELATSRELLERASGQRVVGFRSPNFDMNARGLELLAATGYSYDASGYPTPWLLAARLALGFNSRDPKAALRLRAIPFTWRRRPHSWACAAGAISEFPVSVTPMLRWPVYHTLRYVTSDERFDRILDGFARRGEELSYPMHAVDALGLEEDGIDSRLASHPGMRWRLDSKGALLDRTLAAITARFQAVPFRDRLASGSTSRPEP